MVDVLRAIDTFCSDKGLRYCLAWGTLLGAVRHGGFIPWDDDLDIHMPRKDYEKLWKLLRRERSGRYVLCRTTKNRNYHHRVMQMVDTGTTFIHTRCVDEDIEHGVYIKPEYNGNRIMAIITEILLRLIPGKNLRYKIWKAAEKHMVKYCYDENYASSKYVKVITSTMKELRHPFLKEWFGDRKMQFEDIEVNVPSNAEAYLTAMYGDYMALPPEEKRIVRHNTIYIDLNTPYEKYKGIYYCR